MLNVVVSIFEVESEAYQAITELKNQKGLKTSIMSEAVLVDKKNGYYTILDNFVIEPDAMDDMAKGGLIGMCIGILGGPLGMLLGASVGSFAGVVSETDKTAETASMLEQMILKLSDNTLAIIGLAEEKDESEIDELLSKYKTIIARFDAAVVEQEVVRPHKYLHAGFATHKIVYGVSNWHAIGILCIYVQTHTGGIFIAKRTQGGDVPAKLPLGAPVYLPHDIQIHLGFNDDLGGYGFTQMQRRLNPATCHKRCGKHKHQYEPLPSHLFLLKRSRPIEIYALVGPNHWKPFWRGANCAGSPT